MSLLEVGAGQHSQAGRKPVNEDACGLRFPPEELLATKGIAAVVADGVSQAEGGKEAAEACVQGFLNDFYSTPESWSVKRSGSQVIAALNRWLYGQGFRVYGASCTMASTLSALVLKSTTAHLFHVGDTRIYRLRGETLECLTQDHKAELGERTFLGRAMGIETGIEIDYGVHPLETGDAFILTTDGVHGFLSRKRILDIVRAHPDPEEAAQTLVREALKAGSPDNLTAQVLRVKRLPPDDEEAMYRRLTELPFPPPLEPGMVLDGYRILRELHASKRTQLYAALDAETGEKAVLKTPSVNYEDDPEYIDRFLHEEWVGRRVSSPHLLKVLAPRRRRFLYTVTEYVEGQSLRQWMHDHPRPSLLEVRRIVEQIAKGLRALHRLEMVHQDLKPENILIDAHGVVKIIDFGSTRIAGLDEIATPWPREGMVGTLNYAAPECLQGYPGSPASDIFSLGVIAYELLTGHLPYGRELTPKNLPTARYTPAMKYNPEVPAWMDGAIRKALAKDPRRRYGDVMECLHDLTHPNPALVPTQPLPLIERHPEGFWKGVSAALALLNLLFLYALIG